ncbi:MAG TPA: Eco57I restriction-modification methylase domain-containing protein [Burkholderiales bacterium]|nr:Eco57I restriction-modification methylase domain-containing protein [Burkholderiales bacterium]
MTIHLNYNEKINFGAYYTPQFLIDKVYELIEPYFSNKDVVIFDSSAGDGSFLKKDLPSIKTIANDIDEFAFDTYLSNKTFKAYNLNSLVNLKRKTFKIQESDFLIIIGNPPYNDHTSYNKKSQKHLKFKVDDILKCRDIGISFLRSYDKLNANLICVLHPLSYLIKESNFKMLKSFKENYRLIKGYIFNSEVFANTSKSSKFPIIIALYEKTQIGMSYDYIKNFEFIIMNHKNFSLNKYDHIGNYICKYPSKNKHSDLNLYFYSLRDINALKRNKTFIESPIYSSSIPVNAKDLYYFCYIDTFKKYINELPYYFGNCDILINNDDFFKIKEYFLIYAYHTNKILKNNNNILKYYQSFLNISFDFSKKIIDGYFYKTFNIFSAK